MPESPPYPQHSQPYIAFPTDPRDSPRSSSAPLRGIARGRHDSSSPAPPTPMLPTSGSMFDTVPPQYSPFFYQQTQPPTSPARTPSRQQSPYRGERRSSLCSAQALASQAHSRSAFILDPRRLSAPFASPSQSSQLPGRHEQSAKPSSSGTLTIHTPMTSSTPLSDYPGQFPTDQFQSHTYDNDRRHRQSTSSSSSGHQLAFGPDSFERAGGYDSKHRDGQPQRPWTTSTGSRSSHRSVHSRSSSGESRSHDRDQDNAARRQRQRRIAAVERRPTLTDSMLAAYSTLKDLVRGK